jgi:hypothetical protein
MAAAIIPGPQIISAKMTEPAVAHRLHRDRQLVGMHVHIGSITRPDL